jgi:hypothetical protein
MEFNLEKFVDKKRHYRSIHMRKDGNYEGRGDAA